MIRPPNDAAAFPADYLAYMRSSPGEHRLPGGVLFQEPRDPGVWLGRQGNENFWYSVIIGETHDGLFLVLKYDSRRAYESNVWQYCLVKGAEWDVARDFRTFGELLDFVKTPRRDGDDDRRRDLVDPGQAGTEPGGRPVPE